MELGTNLHQVFTEAMHSLAGTTGGHVLAIHPFRVHTWGDGQDRGLSGTFDDVILDLQGGKMFVLDHKTASESSFRSRCGDSKFGGALDTHLMQVAAYAASDELQALAERLDLEVVPMVVYWSKDDLTPFPQKATTRFQDAARVWTEQMHIMLEFSRDKGGFLPREIPELWECSYCPLWPAALDTIHPTIKARKAAVAERGQDNHLTCQSCTTIGELKRTVEGYWKEVGCACEPALGTPNP